MLNKKNVGVVSFNIHASFTNYGSALQSWALHKVLKKMNVNPILIDYCPKVLEDKDILNPINNMWDKDNESRQNIEIMLPDIEKNYYKFEEFYNNQFHRTCKEYTNRNFEEVVSDEKIDGFICGSDTIFCIDEFEGFDDGYFANYPCMKNKSVSYAASFGDAKFDSNKLRMLDDRMKNFLALGIRENRMINYLEDHTNIPVQRTIDPTLLLSPEEYNEIVGDNQVDKKYLLLYSRRYNDKMQEYAERIAKENNWEIVEISIRGKHKEKGHLMRYDAGVEEFLALVKNSEYVVTNSFHGLMFAVQFKKNFTVFSRESGDSKIEEALDLFGLKKNLVKDSHGEIKVVDDYEIVHNRINKARVLSLEFLRKELDILWSVI